MIEAKPKFKISVILIILSVVYERLWCINEVYAARKARIEVFCLFYPSVLLLLNFAETIVIKTESRKCSEKKDEVMLERKLYP